MRFSPASFLLLCVGTSHSFRVIKKRTTQTCGAKGLSAQIVNGEDASECEWKWQVGLTDYSFNSLPFCGGMLISEEWVLTAAHCVKTPNFYVVAGDWKPKSSSAEKQKIKAAEVHQHSNYDENTMQWDFALVKLEKPFNMNACVGTVCLPDKDQVVKPGTTCWITGWGTLKSSGRQPDILQEGQVEIISGSDCVNKFAYSHNDIDNKSMICAQGKDSYGNIIDACQGDSGGPLVCQEGGTWFLHGATSWGYGCAGRTYPGIWARVTAVRTWIDVVMSAVPAPAPPAPQPGSASCATFGCNISYKPSQKCQCNTKCGQYKNCCSDYWTLCTSSSPAPPPAPAPTPPAGSCAAYKCFSSYNKTRPCQCNDKCKTYKNCCDDFDSLCGGPAPVPSPVPSPTPTPPSPPYVPSPSPGSEAYWSGVNLNSKADVQRRLRSGANKLSYGDLWTAYKSVWVNLPGKCQGKVFDIYSSKCWTPGSSQCGTYRREGDCYNREHSWPKSWWGRAKNAAYSDMFHVMPSDGYVNGRRGSLPFCEVSRASYTSNDGHKSGSCSTSGFSGTGFEPIDEVKGLVARGHLYMSVRYAGELTCCGKDGVDGTDLKPWYRDLILKWHAAFPPAAWEVELNNRIQGKQGNRNPFIDFPELATKLF